MSSNNSTTPVNGGGYCCDQPACFLITCNSCDYRNALKNEFSALLGKVAAGITGEEFWRTFFFKEPSVCVLQHYNTLISIIDPARNQRVFDEYINIYKGVVRNCGMCVSVGYGADGKVVELERNEDTCLYFGLRDRVKILLVKLLENVVTAEETSKLIDENEYGMLKILKQIKTELIVVDSANETDTTEGETS